MLPTGQVMSSEPMPVLNFSDSQPQAAASEALAPLGAVVLAEVYDDISNAVAHHGRHSPSRSNESSYYFWRSCLMSLLGGIISALPALPIGRRLVWSRRETLLWMIGMIFLSWPGVLMLLAMIPWPARYACPNCRKLRVVTRESCEHCGAPAPIPPHKDTEIFEAAAPWQWDRSLVENTV